MTLINNVYNNFFDNLPVALFLQCGDNAAIQCCHGGIESRINPKEFLASKKSFWKVGNENDCKGLFWNDFCVDKNKETETAIRKSFGKESTQEYLGNNPPIHGICRAHQDQYGVLFFANKPFESQAEKFDYKTSGPFRWNEVAESDESIKASPTNQLIPNKCAFPMSAFTHPVFTFSTAVEARSFPYDNFGIVNTFSDWGKWMLEVYEYFLGKENRAKLRHGKFIHLHVQNNDQGATNRVMPEKSTYGDDLISVWWDDKQAEKTLLDEGMEAIIKKSSETSTQKSDANSNNPSPTPEALSTPSTTPTDKSDEPPLTPTPEALSTLPAIPIEKSENTSAE